MKIYVAKKKNLDELKQSDELKTKIETYRQKVVSIVNDKESAKYKGINIFKYMRNCVAHGSNFTLERRLLPIIDDGSELLKNIIVTNVE